MGVGVLSKSNVTGSVVDHVLRACASQFGIGDDLEWGRLHARELRTAAADLQQGISALQHQQRLVLGLIDERGAYTADGSRDAADWAASHLGLSRRTAVDQLDLGRRLAELPAIAEQAATGALSTEQARPAARLAEAGDEATWADEAPTMGVANLQRRAARRRRPSAADHAAARSARTFDSWVAGQELRFRGSVPIDGGAALLKSIERAMPDRDPESPATLGQRQADGLLALASASITADADPDRATVVLIAELAAVCDDDPAATAELETGEPVATQTARRLVCDGRLSVLVQDRTGQAVGIGTTARTVTPAMRRALVVRDGQCRFGTCTARRFLHAHHIEHWPAPTAMGNLALVCYEHHHALHEGGWHLTGDPFGELVAVHSDGRRSQPSLPVGHAPVRLGRPRARGDDGAPPPRPPDPPSPPSAPSAPGTPGTPGTPSQPVRPDPPTQGRTAAHQLVAGGAAPPSIAGQTERSRSDGAAQLTLGTAHDPEVATRAAPAAAPSPRIPP
jgi:hypothetical protein